MMRVRTIVSQPDPGRKRRPRGSLAHAALPELLGLRWGALRRCCLSSYLRTTIFREADSSPTIAVRK
jgi:hypothetical protein